MSTSREVESLSFQKPTRGTARGASERGEFRIASLRAPSWLNRILRNRRPIEVNFLGANIILSGHSIKGENFNQFEAAVWEQWPKRGALSSPKVSAERASERVGKS